MDITLEEVKHAIKNLPNNKAPGIDGLVNEFLKCTPDIFLSCITQLFNKMLETGYYPQSWCDAIIMPLYKKGNHNDVENYRGISLLSVLGKLFTKIANNRMVQWADAKDKFYEEQAGYMKGKSTIDHIFTLYAMSQKYTSKKKGRFYVVFIDFSKAFDSIPHLHLWYRLINQGIHGRLLNVLRSMYAKLRSCVLTQQGLTDFFQCFVGTRQGCMVSPLLFILYLNELLKCVKSRDVKVFILMKMHRI